MKKHLQIAYSQQIIPSQMFESAAYPSYENFSMNNSIISHTNPINRQRMSFKTKNNENMSAMHRRQNSEKSCFEIQNYMNSQRSRCKTYQTESPGFQNDLMKSILERVANNQREIQSLKKMQNRELPTHKLQRNFTEIKDIYNIIKDQSTLQDDINKKMSQEIQKIKKILPNFKEQINNSLKFNQQYQIKLKNIQKTVQNKLQADSQKKQYRKAILNTIETIRQKLCQQIKTMKTETKQKMKQLQNKLTSTKYNNLKEYVCKSQKKCKPQQIIEISARQYIKKDKQKILHQFVYYIDSHGHLLDQNKFYLLDENGNMVKIHDEQISNLQEKCNIVSQHEYETVMKDKKGQTINHA